MELQTLNEELTVDEGLTVEDISGKYEDLYRKIDTNKIDVNKVKISHGDNEYTPLHLAVILNNYEAVYILHHYFKAKINVATSYGTTPLHDSVLSKVDIMYYLLGNGAYVDAVDSTGATAAYYACLEKKFNYLILLNDYGTDLHIKDKDGDTPYKLILDNGAYVDVKWSYYWFYTCGTLYFPQVKNFYHRMIETYF